MKKILVVSAALIAIFTITLSACQQRAQSTTYEPSGVSILRIVSIESETSHLS